MLFNSLLFLVFFPTVCLGYYLLPQQRWRNIFLLISSYYFYMNWNPVYALLLFFSTLVTYLCGIMVSSGTKYKKKILILGLLINLGILFVFKYYNFINTSVFHLLSALKVRWDIPNLDILLPVGISFYTFQAVGYSIDVYRGNIKVERNFFIYALFVSFFPQLVAGPIERAKNLLPQFREKHLFNCNQVISGIKLMLWGYFMKLCVADRVAMYVDAVYNHVPNHNGNSLLLATFFFSIQIYCDFGGYSLIAIGTAKVLGFSLMENFKRPYWALSVKEFWKRWHISLSTWFMDYVYIPLGGNRVSYVRHLRNLMITFVVSGIWHGANWTFFLWGILHGIFLIVENIKVKFIGKKENERWFEKLFNLVSVFVLTSFAWIFFRANSVDDAFLIIKKIVVERGPVFQNLDVLALSVLSIFLLFLKDGIDEYMYHAGGERNAHVFPVRHLFIPFLITYILLFGVLDNGSFIYFQF